jgi:NAD(P)-dependent dehydrogenase (short-subunit alcohol dehydrogenase family)
MQWLPVLSKPISVAEEPEMIKMSMQWFQQYSAGRAGLPDDIGGVVAFLCTEDAGWITAQRIEVSGGMFF